MVGLRGEEARAWEPRACKMPERVNTIRRRRKSSVETMNGERFLVSVERGMMPFATDVKPNLKSGCQNSPQKPGHEMFQNGFEGFKVAGERGRGGGEGGGEEGGEGGGGR